MKTIKLNQPASVNGGAYVFKKGDIVKEGDVPEWVFYLLKDGYADEVRVRKKDKTEAE